MVSLLNTGPVQSSGCLFTLHRGCCWPSPTFASKMQHTWVPRFHLFKCMLTCSVMDWWRIIRCLNQLRLHVILEPTFPHKFCGSWIKFKTPPTSEPLSILSWLIPILSPVFFSQQHIQDFLCKLFHHLSAQDIKGCCQGSAFASRVAVHDILPPGQCACT